MILRPNKSFDVTFTMSKNEPMTVKSTYGANSGGRGGEGQLARLRRKIGSLVNGNG